MNKETRAINTEEVLFFDIETVSRNKNLDINSREYENFAWVLRDKDTGYIPPYKEVNKVYKNKAALNHLYNKIVVISIGFIKDHTLYYKSIIGEQAYIVQEFYKVVETTGFKVCGHNIIGFDIPGIRMKTFEEGLDLSIIPNRIMDVGKKPWDLEKNMIDTMILSKGTSYMPPSLDGMCMLKNIRSSKEDISGAYVSSTFYEEGVDRIAVYCNKDVIATAELFCELQGKKGYITKYVDKSNSKILKEQDINVLSHILASGELTSKTVVAIVDFTEEHNLSAKDVLTLVKTALSKTREYQKVEEEDFFELKEALGLSIDYSKIDCVVQKKNLGKKEVDILTKLYKKSAAKERKEVVSLAEQYLIENNKIEQKRAKEALAYLKEQLK